MDISKWAEKQNDTIDRTRKKFAFNIFKDIVLATPVDTGRARGNWQIGVGQDIQETTERESPSGENITEESKKLDSVKGDESIFISNNLPYITVLEYGGYSKNSKTGKTVNGYSKQAPNGMVGMVLAKKEKLIKDALENK